MKLFDLLFTIKTVSIKIRDSRMRIEVTKFGSFWLRVKKTIKHDIVMRIQVTDFYVVNVTIFTLVPWS